ncbi:MAG: CRISPR-associated endonuclease Cas2, partial [Acidobacteria bacterium]|nr:CRISPR-associated endonuclease Cas2 [Acidobacteriota bacterium]
MQIVLVYDIPDDKRRTRLRKTLMRFGTPVQY